MSEAEEALDGLAATLDDLIAAGHQDLALRLIRLAEAVGREAATRRTFARALEGALLDHGGTTSNAKPVRPGGRRAVGVLDPYTLYTERGERELEKMLHELTVEQLKDIISEHGMDRDKLAMKWKTPDRLIERIIETVRARLTKGEVFLRQ